MIILLMTSVVIPICDSITQEAEERQVLSNEVQSEVMYQVSGQLRLHNKILPIYIYIYANLPIREYRNVSVSINICFSCIPIS